MINIYPDNLAIPPMPKHHILVLSRYASVIAESGVLSQLSSNGMEDVERIMLPLYYELYDELNWTPFIRDVDIAKL